VKEFHAKAQRRKGAKARRGKEAKKLFLERISRKGAKAQRGVVAALREIFSKAKPLAGCDAEAE
jgi:hypothetical protein